MKKMSMTIKARTNVTLSLTLLFIFAFSAGIIWCVARSSAPKLVKALVLNNRTQHQKRSSTWTRTVEYLTNVYLSCMIVESRKMAMLEVTRKSANIFYYQFMGFVVCYDILKH